MLRSFWQWFTQPDPTPGFTVGKIGKLMLKSFLFASLVVTLQTLLLALGVRFVATWWGTLLIFLVVYIPFARILTVDFTPRAATGPKSGAGKGSIRKTQKRRKFAGVKKGGPRF